jgi:hypothetical protein
VFRGSSRELVGCLWRNIRNIWRFSLNLVSFKVGGRFLIRFWHDVWCTEVALTSWEFIQSA